jgi:hypothetical protein
MLLLIYRSFDVDQDCGLDIFKMINNNAEIVKEIITRELLDFKRFHVDVKDIKNPYNGGRNMSLDSMQLVFLQNKS